MIRNVLIVGVLSAVKAHETASWELVESMPHEASDLTATYVGDSTIIVAGGCQGDNTACDAYDGCYYCPEVSSRAFSFSDGTFEELPLMPRERYRHAAAYAEGSLYLFGGRDFDDNIIQEVDAYSKRTGEWRTVSSVGWAATSDLAAFAFGSTIFVYGGYDLTYEASKITGAAFDARDDTFDGSFVPALNMGRGDFALMVVGGDEVVAVGGWNVADFCVPLTSVERLQLPITDSSAWVDAAPLFIGRGDKAAASDGTVAYVAGGERKSSDCSLSVPVHDVERLTSATAGQWDVIADIPEERMRFAAAVSDGHLYIFGGQEIHSTTACATEHCHPVSDHVWKLVVHDDDDEAANDPHLQPLDHTHEPPTSSSKKSSGGVSKFDEGLLIGLFVGLVATAVLAFVYVKMCLSRPSFGPTSVYKSNDVEGSTTELVDQRGDNRLIA